MAHLIQRDSDDKSLARLKQIYDPGLIAPEKKPFLVDLKKSIGPYLAIADCDDFILDGCSQIATLGLGFNASPLFAPCHHIESWTGDYQTENIRTVARSYRDLLKRLLGHQDYNVQFCSSGAEAVEIGLGLCFENRKHKAARKVLAFEGSFHGRMMVALASTANPKKREPFAWPGKESDFVAYPFVHGNSNVESDENQSLAMVDQKLASGDFFAVLIEPMQCEGGDRYSRPSFHNRLIELAHSHKVPLVYDEVQTGFHLGNSFFWHQGFDNPAGPDVVCCAKKSQVGIVLSKFDVPYWESFCPASLIRGYACANILDQYADKIVEMGTTNQARLQSLVDSHSELITNPRAQGLAFAFDCADADLVKKIVGRRFQHGLLFYPAGQKTARFRVNLGCKPQDLKILWDQIESCLADSSAQHPRPILLDQNKSASDYQFHSELVQLQINPDTAESSAAMDYLNRRLTSLEINNAQIDVVDKNNYSEFRDRILAMQNAVYEPLRQTPPSEFDLLFDDEKDIGPISIVVTVDQQIIAMAFCGRLALFAQERGVTQDPCFDDDKAYYMVDLTVVEKHRGGLGRCMKNAIAMLALSKGVASIHGRNRDRLARGMWAINLSLGGFETQHLHNDYQDDQEHRDCLYYQLPLTWPDTKPPDVAFNSIDKESLTRGFVQRNLSAMVNKICLSNFVTEEFLEDLQLVSSLMPEQLQHAYTASSLSECVDKITKAIWLKRKPNNHLLTIEQHYFGEGSFLARSLSGSGDPFFETVRLKHLYVEQILDAEVKRNPPLAFYVQVEQFDGHEEYLYECVKVCRDNEIPIVFNETGPRFGTPNQFSRIKNCQPDATIVWLGGQMAMAFTTSKYFADDPLLLISTWDGDAYSLARFAQFVRTHNQHETVGGKDD